MFHFTKDHLYLLAVVIFIALGIFVLAYSSGYGLHSTAVDHAPSTGGNEWLQVPTEGGNEWAEVPAEGGNEWLDVPVSGGNQWTLVSYTSVSSPQLAADTLLSALTRLMMQFSVVF